MADPAGLFMGISLMGRAVPRFGLNILLYIYNRTFILRTATRKQNGLEGAMKKREISRRGVLQGSLMASALAGTASFFGPWQETRVGAQGAAKPIKLGLTCDASGQY